MLYFINDYSEGCHPRILDRLLKTNFEQTPGYGMDAFCIQAADKIRALCENDRLQVHFLVGGTQANLTVIDAALRPHQAVIAAVSAHIHVHETGAVEATGHKVLPLPSKDGKLTVQQLREIAAGQRDEHMVQPKMVYISNPTELGTIYSLRELESLSKVCAENGWFLFLDGARLGYALTAKDNDLTLADIARLCDVFYIGGTKVGALFGEAVVIKNPAVAEDFRYLIKQHGGMLAKGRLLGIQFAALFEDGLYFEIASYANRQADRIREALAELHIPLLVPGTTNQIFPILPDPVLDALAGEYVFTEQERVDDKRRAIRLCTNWATSEENVSKLCEVLKKYCLNL